MSLPDQAVALASSEIGKPYVYGAEGPNSFDCSGLVQWVYQRLGVDLPRTAAEQQAAAVPVSNPQPGDLVFYGSPADHVAIYAGGGQMIAAPHTGAKVQLQAVYGTPSGYGRVTGSSVANRVLGTAGAAVQNTGLFDSVTSGITDTISKVAYTVVFAGLGIGLIALGANRMVMPRVKEAAQAVAPIGAAL